MEPLNIEALGIDAYLAALGGGRRCPAAAEANLLSVRFSLILGERERFYVRLLEERDAARQEGKPPKFEEFRTVGFSRVPLKGAGPADLRRLAQIGSADPMFHQLFRGSSEDSVYRFGLETLQAASLPDAAPFREWFVQRAVSDPTVECALRLVQAVLKRLRGGLPFGDHPIQVLGRPNTDPAIRAYNDAVAAPTRYVARLLASEAAEEGARQRVNELYLRLLEEAKAQGRAVRGEELMKLARPRVEGAVTYQVTQSKNRGGAVGVSFIPPNSPSLNLDEVLGTAPSKPREPWEENELGFALKMGTVDALATKAAERLGLPTGNLSKAVGYALLGAAFDLAGHIGRPGLAKLGAELGPALNVWGAARGMGALATVAESLLSDGGLGEVLSGVRMVVEEAGLVEGDEEAPTTEGKGLHARR